MLNLSPWLPWSCVMKTVVRNEEFQTSRIEILPFINLDPTNLSTIYTALCFAQELCEKNNKTTCLVTFDQPLFQKASEIVASSSNLDKVILRLGGFHLMMSYLGCIGQIMSGSGLAELWEQVYAERISGAYAIGPCLCANSPSSCSYLASSHTCFNRECILVETN